MQSEYYITEIRDRIKLLHILNFDDNDPKCFRNSKLVKYQLLEIENNEISFRASLNTCMSDRENVSFKIKFMEPTTEEVFNAAKELYMKEIKANFEKVTDKIRKMRG